MTDIFPCTFLILDLSGTYAVPNFSVTNNIIHSDIHVYIFMSLVISDIEMPDLLKKRREFLFLTILLSELLRNKEFRYLFKNCIFDVKLQYSTVQQTDERV